MIEYVVVVEGEVLDTVPGRDAELVLRPYSALTIIDVPAVKPPVHRRRPVVIPVLASAFVTLLPAGYLLGTSALGAAIAAWVLTAAAVVGGVLTLIGAHGHRCRCFICGRS